MSAADREPPVWPDPARLSMPSISIRICRALSFKAAHSSELIMVTSAVEYPLRKEHCCTRIRTHLSLGKIRYPYIKKKGDVKHFSPQVNCMLIVLFNWS
jgi:hypothetical protein